MNKKYSSLLTIGCICLLVGILLKLNVLSIQQIESIPILKSLCAVIFEGIVAFGSGLIVAFFTVRIKISEKVNELLSKSGKEKAIGKLFQTKGILNGYIQTKAKKLLSFDEECRTRTAYNVNARIQNNKVIVETTISYTMYFDSKKSSIVKLCFDSEPSVAEYIKITNPNNSNDSITFEKKDLTFEKIGAHGEGLIYEYSCLIPKKYKRLNYVNIEKKYTLYGEDHWINYGIIFQHLTNGLDFSLNISSDLKINEITIFEQQDIFSKKQSDYSLTMKTSQWLSRYGGFSIIIAKR